MTVDEVERSLELASRAGEDLTSAVYARLFASHPEMEPLFVRDTNGSVRGEMLARVFEMILDFIDRRTYAAQMIQCEVITHEGYGVPREVFGVFFETVADTLRDHVREAWTEDMEIAWRGMINEMVWYVDNPNQSRSDGPRALALGESPVH